LRELGQRLELEGGNPYRARAYGRAAENLSLISMPLDQLVAEGRLKEIPGIGDALAAVISQLHETGHHPRLETMREKMPEGVLEMLHVPGLRPERVRKLYKELGIASLTDLEDAAGSGMLASTKGYAYLGLTDHSQSAHYAGGLKVEEVAAQQRAIERLNKRYGAQFHVFKGIESDILGDGSLDYAPHDCTSVGRPT
jgi:DNA polymerase/3'-5' exonuclease PolX